MPKDSLHLNSEPRAEVFSDLNSQKDSVPPLPALRQSCHSEQWLSLELCLYLV